MVLSFVLYDRTLNFYFGSTSCLYFEPRSLANVTRVLFTIKSIYATLTKASLLPSFVC
ncbi:hypothetical protein BDQ17DRAFT_1356755, partial [Cyathus striatus]